MQRFACAVLPRIDNILGAQSAIPKPTVCTILMAINSLSTQLEREIQVEDMEKELETLRAKQLEQLKVKATATNDDEDDA